MIEAFKVHGRQNHASTFWTECVALEVAESYCAAWADLIEVALEPNIFLDPCFAIPAAHCLPTVEQPVFLLAWMQVDTAPRSKLMALWPLLLPKSVLGFVAKTWRHDFSCLGSPILDCSHALPCLNLMLEWLTCHYPNINALNINQIDRAGPFHRLLRSRGSVNEPPFNVIERYERASLDKSSDETRVERLISPKKRKELHRQLRRLRDLGDVAFGVASEGEDLCEKIESFIILEAKGWKGAQKTAFLNNEAQLAFLRAMAGLMGRQAKCRVYWLSLNGEVIAANIVLSGQANRAYFWKTAYDEAFRTLSPGVLLTMEMTNRLLQEKAFVLIDSCAVPNHRMIDHIWHGRIELVDILVSLQPHRAKALKFALFWERLRRRLLMQAKGVLARFGPGRVLGVCRWRRWLREYASTNGFFSHGSPRQDRLRRN